MSEELNEVAVDEVAPKKARKARAPKLDENGEPIVKAPKEPKVKAPRVFAFPRENIVTVLVDANPKRAGSAAHARFDLYTSGQTVAEALAAGVIGGDLFHDVGHSFIAITAPE